jgi:transposase
VPASNYPDARHIPVRHEHLHAAQGCPACTRGTLYELAEPMRLLRIVGRSPLGADCWDCQRLRCSACGLVFTAKAPPEAQGPKYTESAAAMMVLLRYGTGVPLNRLDHLQRDLRVPVPASTQWDVARERIAEVQPVFEELRRRAAQGEVVHNDDTTARILEFMGRRRAELLAKGELPDPERTGLFTTSIISKTAEGHSIALFSTGRKHAGENLADVLGERDADLPVPILMCDALDRNVPEGHPVIEANCMAHGRRHVVDEVANFPSECAHLLKTLRKVFRVDSRCRAEGLSPEARLAVHQRESGPVLDDLQKWMTALLEGKRIEPNSGLGQALIYLLKRWSKLTLFLRVPGAPLENNICERALKHAIRHRKNSLFYKTQRGACVGDIWMTLIHTATLSGENPFHYLTVLQRHAKAVAERSRDWLPWNYRVTLAALEAGPRSGHGGLPPPAAAATAAPAGA